MIVFMSISTRPVFFSPFLLTHSQAGTAIASTRELVAESGFLTIVAFDLGYADVLCTAL